MHLLPPMGWGVRTKRVVVWFLAEVFAWAPSLAARLSRVVCWLWPGFRQQ
jgi:hypothetical protein